MTRKKSYRLARIKIRLIYICLLTAMYYAPVNHATTCGYTPYVWPPNGITIPLNAQFVVFNTELPSSTRPILEGLTGSIPLAIGTFYRVSPYPARNPTWLIPTRALTPNTRYELSFANPKAFRLKYERIGVPAGDIEHRNWEPFHWMTSMHEDHEAPSWNGQPMIIEAKSWTGFDDGSEISIQVPIFEENCIALVDLIAEKRYLIQTVVPITSQLISLRTGMCYGPLNLRGSERYQMRLTAIDMAGNRSDPSEIIDFCVPDYPPSDEYRMNVTFSPEVEVIERPEISTTEPAKKARIQGNMEIKLTLASDGSVTQVESVKRLPMGLSENAERVIRTWKFAPADSIDLRKIMVTVEVQFIRVPYQPVWNP